MTNPVDLPLADVGRLLRAGSLSSLELVELHLARTRARNPSLGAFVLVTEELARAGARSADAAFRAGVDKGPMQGVPFAVKDVIDTAGVVTTCGSRHFAERVPTRDAVVVERLLEGGAVLLGKVATYEFALSGPTFDQPHPPPRNPWRLSRITGGSSSGSAAAVAAGLVRVALGTDTGGSARSPASYCGVVGFKPGRSRVPRTGVHPLSPSLDHVGVLAASVDDAATCTAVIAADDAIDRLRFANARPALAGLSVGYARDWFADDPSLEPAVLEAIDRAVSTLSLLGARVAPVELPPYAPLEALGARIIDAEAFAGHERALADGAIGYGRLAARCLRAAGAARAAAEPPTSASPADDLAACTAFAERVDADVLTAHEVLVTACTLGVAPPFDEFDDDTVRWTPMRTLPFNLSGHPALVCPIGFHDGLPIGMQLVARHGEEALLLGVGAAFARGTDHDVPRPDFG